MNTRLPLQIAAALFCTAAACEAYISEPETLLYGRIINRAGPVDQLVTEGELTWTLRRPDGTQLLLNASVGPYGGGVYSYSVAVPHQALSFGQQATATVVSLEPVPTKQRIAEILYNGQPARILAPASASFDVTQAQRGAAHRIDLEINVPMADSDGDGMADWWEDANGLDKQLASDALLDPDGDGRNNLAEYLAGLDPNRDSRFPSLLTSEVTAYSRSTSIVMLKAADLDSSAAQLHYTLTVPPDSGTLVLRNAVPAPAGPDRVLGAGAAFSQQDVADGRLVYRHAEGSEPASFAVRLADENAAHPAVEATVRLLLYDPSPTSIPADAGEALRLAAHAAASGSAAVVVADLSNLSGSQDLAAPSGRMTPESYAQAYVPAYGEDRPHELLGGAGADKLTGGMKADVLCGGPGNDELSGKGGADRFVFPGAAEGNDTLLDFAPQEGDLIDLSPLLAGTSRLLTDYVRVTRSGADAVLGVDSDGTAADYDDVVITLKNSPLTQADLRPLFESGRLLTGTVGLPPLVTIAATVPRASENGPPAGRFVVSRSGMGGSAISVGLQITGSATNGSDYPLLNPSAVIPAEEGSVVLEIAPYADAVTELDETIRISILPGAGYEIAAGSNAAEVVIEDLKPQVTIEALNGLAQVSTLEPGAFVLVRSGVIDRSVLVRLNIGGNAANGVDYNRIDNYFNLTPYQTSGVIQVVPKPTAVLQRGAESVIISVKPDAAYRIGDQPSASVVIVPEAVDLESWRDRNFAGNNQPLDAFTLSDPGGFGLPMLVRYGFGLNPSNPRADAAALLPRPEIRDGHLTLRFQKSPAARDISYQVEVSEDLRHWRPGGSELEDLSLVESLGDPTAGIYRVAEGVQQSTVKYLRVRIARIQP